ncbi:polyhydroxyalkanoate depolymerase [Hyphomicrobium sp.]|uniref:polyhydroxyalkanoate depolymerase n=1 Tax=Hyphomicrobium sp. TaxID=82 RepID=UPI0025BCC90F|nr:polyhydroxyalkanoate depolymerase [Hyphomicrobium sp.]MCC7252785.1 polyhydroxyalkanoate depolymerase [Hyphomicrobium sp.]
MLYHWYEIGHAALKPARAVAEQMRYLVENPFNPFSHTSVGRHASAACEVFERTTRRYEKPGFGLSTTRIGRRNVKVGEEVVWNRPFCRLIHFRRDMPAAQRAADPRILLIAPMSGHFATLLRGTVEALLPSHEVYITDWQDARSVPVSAGRFGLDDYIDYVRDMLAVFRGDVHVFAVCQSAVPALAAVSLMEEDGDPSAPLSMILAGGPIDTRVSPTAVNDVAVSRGTDWFARHVITQVPWPYAGAGRAVYPGFLQLSGFMSMNLDRHAKAHKDLFRHLVSGDGDSAEKHRAFYDEYLAVMDLTAEFYLDTIDRVFVHHTLPKGEMMHRGRRVDPGRIRRPALMTVEGEKDDITGLGQCRAAHDLCTGLAAERKLHIECTGVGHYGIFNGSRFRTEIASRVAQFVRLFDPRAELILTRPITSRRAVAASVAGYDPSSVAFTFEAANDAGLAPQSAGSV